MPKPPIGLTCPAASPINAQLLPEHGRSKKLFFQTAGIKWAKKRPSTLKRQTAKAKSAASKSEPAAVDVVKEKAAGGNGSDPAGETADELVERRKVVSNVASFPLRKKPSRRGIRLK